MTPTPYTHPIIKGHQHKTTLPQGTALVLEGGGTRGFFSAGVFEAFMDAEIIFPYIIGVSAGIANALTYVAGQRERNRIILENYVGNHQYVSICNILKKGSLFGYDYIFKTIPQQHLFFDEENFNNTPIRFLTGATNCITGETEWFEKSDISPGFAVTVASCSIPFLSKIVEYNGLKLLDGGVSTPIPIEKSIADGNTFHVIVLTRNQGYTKPMFRYKKLLKFMYKKYPNLIQTMLNRHEIYNKQLTLCEQLVRENKALIIRPIKPLTVNTTEKNIEKLLALYDEGRSEGALALTLLE